MNTVIIVNLNGVAYHLEEAGYQALQTYLAGAQAQLTENPDRAEIMADLEQAIADKCAHYLRPHKNVLTATEINAVLKEMGPVQTGETGGTTDSAGPAPQAPGGKQSYAAGDAAKRLYQIREGAMLSGVCTGIAAYSNIDVTIVRIVFVVLALLTHGLWILAYVIMMLVIPFANTDEERAAAAGTPFNAQGVIDRAKKHYSEFKDSKEWRQHWRQQRREWRRRWNDGAYWWGHNLQRNVHQASLHRGYLWQIFAGLVTVVLSLVSIAGFFLLIAAILQLTRTGMVLGIDVTSHMPLWVGVLLLCLVYGAIAPSLSHARRAIYMQKDGHYYAWYSTWDSLLGLGVMFVAGWFAYTHIPEVRTFIQAFPETMQLIWTSITDSFHHAAKPGVIAPGAASAAASAASAASVFD
jgi:phage shock protein PspC (stress-responsive transcriptional regulator)